MRKVSLLWLGGTVCCHAVLLSTFLLAKAFGGTAPRHHINQLVRCCLAGADRAAQPAAAHQLFGVGRPCAAVLWQVRGQEAAGRCCAAGDTQGVHLCSALVQCTCAASLLPFRWAMRWAPLPSVRPPITLLEAPLAFSACRKNKTLGAIFRQGNTLALLEQNYTVWQVSLQLMR